MAVMSFAKEGFWDRALREQYFDKEDGSVGLNPMQSARSLYLVSKIQLLQKKGVIPDFTGPALDIGTDIGLGAKVLKNMGIDEVYGIDISHDGLERAITEGRLKRGYEKEGSASRLVEFYGKDKFGVTAAFHAPICYTNSSGKFIPISSSSLSHKNFDFSKEVFYPIDSNLLWKKSFEEESRDIWSRKIPLQAVEVTRPGGYIIFTVGTEYEADILKKVFAEKVAGDYIQIQEEGQFNLDAFLYSGKKI